MQACIYRIPFTIDDLSEIGSLTSLAARTDDGFVAWLNLEIRFNHLRPRDEPQWDSGATATHSWDRENCAKL